MINMRKKSTSGINFAKGHKNKSSSEKRHTTLQCLTRFNGFLWTKVITWLDSAYHTEITTENQGARSKLTFT